MTNQTKLKALYKGLAFVLTLVMLLSILPIFAYAAEGDQEFQFVLSVDGQEIKEVKTGDIITVAFNLVRTDSDDPYTMYAMQNEIRYDSDFFELVPEGTILSDGIHSKDIAMRDSFREFYMNYLSFSGGEQWTAKKLIGSFQLKVIGSSGTTKITSNDFLVSNRDGTDTYKCEANELTIIVSTDCSIRFVSNGGSNTQDITAIYGETMVKPSDPTKDGKVFAGWYKDIDLTKEWDFDTDTISGNMTLYAKWADPDLAEQAMTFSELNEADVQPTVNTQSKTIIFILAAILLMVVLALMAFTIKLKIGGNK